MSTIHDFHRAVAMQGEARELENHIRALEDELVHRHQLLVALEDKLDYARNQDDELGVSFWSDRVEEKRHGLPELEEKLRGVRADRRALVEELERIRPTSDGLSLRQWSDSQEIDDINRMHETESELAAWQIQNSDDNGLFPPLESVLHNPPRSRRRHPWHTPSHTWGSHWTPPPGFPRPAPPVNAPSIGSLREIFSNPELTGTPAREIGTLLDRFLNHFQGQLADTLDGFAARIAPHPSETMDPAVHEAAAPSAPDVRIPGAFVQPDNLRSEAQVQTAEKEKKSKPSSKLGKGGYRHKHITCDGCLTGIRGTRYKCEQCNDYDLCGSCLPLLHTDALHPGSHTFKAMVHPGLEERIKFGGTTSSRAPHQHSRHPATCDICSEVIVGVRWKCLNCPDWDCCSACSKLVPNVHPDHSFVKLHKPTDYVVNAAWDAKNDVHHPFVICDGCNLTIRGPRYKCMHPDCPDYDLCVKCEAAPVPVHPESHPMLKTKTPLRINAKSSFDPIKNVYEDHCRYRVSRDSCKKAGKARSPAPSTQPTAVPKSASPSANTPTAKTPASTSSAEKSSAFSRGEEYAKVVDAIFSSISGTRNAGSKAATVRSEEEEMAAMNESRPVTFSPPKSFVTPDEAERVATPKPVGAFPSSPKTEKKEIAEEARGYELPLYNIPLVPPPPEATKTESEKEEEPLVQLDTPAPSTPTPLSPQAPAFPGCSLPRLPREYDLNAEAENEEAEKSDVEKEEVKETTTTERVDPITAIIAAASPPAAEEKVDPIIAEIAKAAPAAASPPKEPVGPNDILTWVRHSTISPGTTLPPGAEFTKTWLVRHYASGSEFDFKHLRLVHRSEGVLGPACKAHVVLHPEDIVEDADMEVTIEGLKVPHMPGREIFEQWRFEDDKGNTYGQPLRVRINVEEPQSSGTSTASSSFIVPRAPLEHNDAGDSFYLPTPYDTRSPPASDALSERLSSVPPSTVGRTDDDGDDASSTFSFSDVEHITHPSATRTTSTDDFTDDYDFVDETDEETEDGL